MKTHNEVILADAISALNLIQIDTPHELREFYLTRAKFALLIVQENLTTM